jgi:hypothetical protein
VIVIAYIDAGIQQTDGNIRIGFGAVGDALIRHFPGWPDIEQALADAAVAVVSAKRPQKRLTFALMVDADFVVAALGIAVIVGIDDAVSFDTFLFAIAVAAVFARFVIVVARVLVDEIAFGAGTHVTSAIFTHQIVSAGGLAGRLIVTCVQNKLLARFAPKLVEIIVVVIVVVVTIIDRRNLMKTIV